MTNLSGTNLNNGVAVGPQGEGMDSPSNVSTYPAYKDSGVEWLEEVPEGWTVSKLGYFFREPPCYGVLVPDFDPDGVPMLRITDMEHEFIDASGLVTISPSLSAQYARTIVQVGDVVLSLVGTIGKAFEISPKLAGVNLSRAVARIQLGSNTLPRYLCWIFQSREFTHFIDLVCKGTAQRVLNLSDLNAFSFTFPSYSEQCAISRFLDHETARIDALIEEQQRLIELLKEKRQAVISHAVTKGLDPAVPMKDSGVEWLGEVPAHWVKKRLKNISPFITVGIVVNPSDYVSDEGLPFLYGGEVKEGFIEVDKARKISPEDSKKNRKTMLETGDIVTMRVGYPGLTAVVPPECAGGNCASVMLVKRGNYDSHWLCAVMNSRLVRQQVEVVQYGAAQKQFNIADAIEFWMFEPPREEQTMIAEFIDRQSSVFNALMEESGRSMQLLQERRSALISAAVTGKIDVRGWQPPASTQAPESAVAEVV
jgi:type I restriction enzyme S subunit